MIQTLSISKRIFLLFILLSVVLSAAAQTVFAEDLPCGNIILPEETIEIDDCENPFGASSATYPFDLKVNDQLVEPLDSILILESGTTDYRVEPNFSFFNPKHKIFLHDGNDYLQVATLPPAPPTEADVRELAAGFFDPEIDAEIYIQRFFGDYSNDDQLDFDLSDAFESYVYDNFVPDLPVLLPGTYTILSGEDGGVLQVQQTTKSWWSNLREFFIPTVYAQFGFNPSYTLTFTLEAEIIEPLGASSILFLPGIQASRLYTDGILGTEDQLWEPNINNDLAALEMNEDGFSVNDIYTNDVLDEIFGAVNVYKGFLDNLEELKDDEQIKDFLPFAYDWRFSVDDIVISGTKYEDEIKSVIDEIEILAEDSFTEKVTIIGHSNGGLLAKAIMVELEILGKEDLVDKVVLVGSPQVGTPKAIGALLHGLDQQAGGGIITDDETAREVMKNMPGAYGLLPSKRYFELVDDVLISQDDSPATAYLDTYEDVTSYATLEQFLKGNHSGESINIPSALNGEMIDRANSLHDSIDNWEAPQAVDVFEIAGVGIPTIIGFEYREFSCTPYLEGLGCISGTYSKPYPVFTTYGDETVVTESALAYGGTKTEATVDLFEEGRGLLNRRFEHLNLTESPTIQTFLDSIIKFGYQNETLEIPEEFIDVTRVFKVIGTHSPVGILVTNKDGDKVGIIDDEAFNEIFGSYIFTFGDSKYVLVPEGEYEVEVPGFASSTFSLTIDNLVGNSQSPEIFLQDLPTGMKSLARFTLSEDVSSIYIDVDGDGTDDIEVEPETGAVTNLKPVVVIEEPSPFDSSSSGTRVITQVEPTGIVAGATISIDPHQEYIRILQEFIKILQNYITLIEKS